MTTTDISMTPMACQPSKSAMAVERVLALTWRICFSRCSVWEWVVHPLGLRTWVEEVEDHINHGKEKMRNYHIKSHWKSFTKGRLPNSRARRMSYAATARVVVARTRRSQSNAFPAREEVSSDVIAALSPTATKADLGMKQGLRSIGPGLVTQETVMCNPCKGTGSVFKEKDRCKKCKGERVTEERKVLELYIPRGSK